MSQEHPVQRRSVLKAAGVATAAGAAAGPFTGSAAATHEADVTPVRVNQIGYPIDGTKRAFVSSDGVDLGSVDSFEIVDTESGETVEEGSLSDTMEDSFENTYTWTTEDGEEMSITVNGTDQDVKAADFTDFDQEGEFKIVVDGEESHPFEVGSAGSVYADLLHDVGRLYTLKRANTHIDDDETGLDIGPGHMQDEEAEVAAPADEDFLEDLEPGDTIDVTGGWYDAGDYGKYVNPTGVTAAQLLLAYDRNPDAFYEGQFNIPDSVDDPRVGEMPDVLAEACNGLEFLMNMQRPNGALFYKCSRDEWPGMDVAPSEDTGTRYVFGNSSVGTAHGAAAMAVGYRVLSEHGYAEDFAEDLLEAAENAFDWLENNPEVVWDLSEDQNSGSGAYGRGPNENPDHKEDAPDRYWAAAALYRATGDSRYEEYIQTADLTVTYEGEDTVTGNLPIEPASGPIDWNDPVGLGNIAYAATDGEGADVAASAMEGPYWIGQEYTDGNPWSTGTYDYYWGWIKSGVSRGVQGLIAMNDGPDWLSEEAPADYLAGPFHHALGRSTSGYSYVTGNGERSTENPHDRIVQSQDTLIPGMLVGGPHNTPSVRDDSTLDHFDLPIDTERPHLEMYADEHDSYATNEWAINYTAPLVMMLAELIDEVEEKDYPLEDDEPPEEDDCMEFGDFEACDTDDDDLYDDFTGDGEVTTADVSEFQSRLFTDGVDNNAEYFNFSGSPDGTVSHGDVVALFQDATGV